MKMYMGFDSYHEEIQGACLVFANTAREAKKLAFPIVAGWFDSEWIDVRVNMIKGLDYLKEMAESDYPHAIEFPDTCPKCNQWGSGKVINGSCPSCNDPDL